MNSRSRPAPIITNSQKSITPKFLTPIRRKNITPIQKQSITPKHVPTVSDIQTYVISDAGKLVKPHSPIGPPPPLKYRLKTPMKRPICKNPNKKVL